MTRGYVHLWRKTENSAIFQNEGLFKVAIWCLWHASHKPMTVGIKTGRGISEVSLAPGQFVFGRHSAARALGMSPSTVWKRMLKLKNLGFLNIESDTHYSVITIVNWHTYQAETEKGDSEGDRQVTTKEHKQKLRECKEDIYSPSSLSCPHEKIIALFHETCPTLPKVRTWTNKRRGHLQARWKEDSERQELGWWRDFFAYVGKSAFLTGQVQNGNRKPFIADLPWIIEPEHFAKILEGKYE